MIRAILLLLLTVLFSCVHAQPEADWVFLNGKIYTADLDQSFAEAIAIKSDTIVYVGSNEGAQAFIGINTQVSDIDGKVILPGLHDVHIHLLEASSEAASSCWLDAWENDPWTLAQNLADCNPQPNDNGWITSWGHSIITLIESSDNPREILDTFFPDDPVAAMEESSHSAWVNSAALEELGIDGDTPDPTGGHIVKDGGEPNGILLDAAGDLAFHASMAPTPTIDGQNYDGLVDFGLPAIRELGITSIVEGRTYWKRNYIETWQQVKDNGELTARVVLAPWAYLEDEDETIIADLTDLYFQNDDMLRISQVKVYIDGHSLNGTAALDQPYVYNFGWPFTNGLNYFTPERLQDIIIELEPMGFDFFIHAIGNRGLKEALDAIEGARDTNGDVGARHRITHLEITNEEDYPRFSELSVTADMQVSANWSQPNQWSGNAFYIGDELAEVFVPLKSIFDEGANVTLSSDWDVSTMNPFRSIQNAVTRAPQNLPDVRDAVDAKTINAAFVMRQEEVTGSLEVGKFADLICIDRDIFTIPQNQIAQTEVNLTLLGGQVVYSNGIDIGIATIDKEDSFKIAPTVTSDYITVYPPTGYGGELRMEVVSLSGGIVASEIVSPGKRSFQFDCGFLSEGIYIVRLYVGVQVFESKILVYR